MNNAVTIGIVIAVIVVLAGYFMFFSSPTEEAVVSPGPSVVVSPLSVQVTPSPTASSSPDANGSPTAGVVKEFAVTGANFAFTPKEIRVKQGDTVRITFTSGSGLHDWNLDEFNAATNVVASGKSEAIEFVADKAGEYEYYCSVGNHRAMGMVGKLIVE